MPAGDRLLITVAVRASTSITSISCEYDGQPCSAIVTKGGFGVPPNINGQSYLNTYHQLPTSDHNNANIVVTIIGTTIKAVIISATRLACTVGGGGTGDSGDSTNPVSGTQTTTKAAYYHGAVLAHAVAASDAHGTWQGSFADYQDTLVDRGDEYSIFLCEGNLITGAAGSHQAEKTGITQRPWIATVTGFNWKC
jgi:hypothetical protein